MYPKLYVQFLYTFNQLHDYYQCHDLLEDLWLEEGREPFYQGLLQVAVAFYHAQQGNLLGAKKLMLLALQKLTLYPSEWMGIHLGDVMQNAQHYVMQLQSSGTIPPDFPILLVDPNLVMLVKQIQFD